MANLVDKIEQEQLQAGVPELRAGDSVRVHAKVVEGDKERIQVFEGVVIRCTGGGSRGTFTVRKVSYGVGVERTFPLHTPRIEKIEVRTHGKVRQARLYYLRELSGKAARIEEKGQRTPPAGGAAKKKAKAKPRPAKKKASSAEA